MPHPAQLLPLSRSGYLCEAGHLFFRGIFQARLLHVLEALPLSAPGTTFRSPTVLQADAVISLPLGAENWGHHNLLRSICPVITENGNTVTVKIQAFLRYTPSRFSHCFAGSFLSIKAGSTPRHMRPSNFQRYPFFPVQSRVKIACDKARTRNRLYLCFFGRSMRFSPTCAEVIDR